LTEEWVAFSVACETVLYWASIHPGFE